MAPRSRSLLLAACVVVGAAFAAGSGGRADAQDVPTTTVVASPQGDVAGSTVVVAPTEPVPESTQTVTEGSTSDRRLVTESRKVLATIAGLVLVALALAVLTFRYWRVTKPVPIAVDAAADTAVDAPADTETALPVEPESPEALVPARRRSRRSVAGADHARADADWEPRGTGEHAAIGVSAPPARARPSRSARAKALGLTVEP